MGNITATKIALALLGASRGAGFRAPVLVEAASVLGVSANAMRIALSRLSAAGDIETLRRGHYVLSEGQLGAFAHVRTFRTGFAARVPWEGGYVGVLTAELSRRNAAAVRRRERALSLVGMRRFRHGLYLRPNNLEGGRAQLAVHLRSLGLDDDADVIELRLDERASRDASALYDVLADNERALLLGARVEAMLTEMGGGVDRDIAAACFFLGDEVLRFLARDPLLPEAMANPAPRRALADAMGRLDDEGYALWTSLLEDAERRSTPSDPTAEPTHEATR